MTVVLVVEDDPKIRAGLVLQLRDRGLAAEAVDNAEAALARLDLPAGAGGARPDLLLLDVRLPGMSGVDLVRRLAAAGRLPPTVVLSGEATITETVEALRLGVHDFLEKPFGPERLWRSIDNALEHAALRRQVAELRNELRGETEILGASPAIAALREQIARAAPTEARVLIRGESGTGKEMVADALHRGSPRRQRRFIKLNCAAIPPALVEDELFGHARGAFTDAYTARPGLFEEADGGTLFLDEIGDMDPALQARLLRVLEDGTVRRVGETRDRQVEVRVLAATHRDLETAVAAGEFRDDLYYRLAHLPIEVPPLRARGGDVRLLFDHFLRREAERQRSRRRRVAAEVYPLLASYPWPGNVRELKSLCERLVVFGGDPVTPDDLPSAIHGAAEPPETGLLRLPAGFAPMPLREFRTRCEREYVESVLVRTGWNVTAAAERLAVNRTHLHQLIRDLGLRRPVGGSDRDG